MVDPLREHHVEVWHNREKYTPVPKIEDVLKRAGVPVHLIVKHMAPLQRAEKIAAEWEKAPDESFDPVVQLAYADLARQSNELFKFVTQELGIKIQWVAEEPYENAREQAVDLRGGHMYTEWGLGRNHPLLNGDEYARFRAVHDVFGHAGIGRGFDRHGEYEAWLVHSGMYVGLGAWAMSSEYRGVNSSLCVGTDAGTGKAALLPRSLMPELARNGAIILGSQQATDVRGDDRGTRPGLESRASGSEAHPVQDGARGERLRREPELADH